MYYDAIRDGIRAASEVRVDEVAEDYPWVKEVLSALESLRVPCEYFEVEKIWRKKFATPQKIPSIVRGTRILSVQHEERGWIGVIIDLAQLGMISFKEADNRIDMPDLYRVGFGLKKMGGVKPGNRGL